MHQDLFGIVGRAGVVRSSDLLAGLRELAAADRDRQRADGRTGSRGGSTLPGDLDGLEIFDACRHLAEQGATALLLRSARHQHLLPLLIDEVGIPVIGWQTVLPASMDDAAQAWHVIDSADSMNPMDPMHLTDALDSANPMDSKDPMDRMDPTDPMAPMAPMDPVEPMDPMDLDRRLADYALKMDGRTARQAFRLGVVGGVGPAATVDFLNKVVRSTQAARDQDHIKVLLEQNPQIPDRTACLLNGGADPSVALYATCRRLERQGASAIAIPCNTAHAFVPRIAPRLGIPVIDMIAETLDYIVREQGGAVGVGLLATTGTVSSKVYADAAAPRGLTLLTPPAAAQAQVMDAIYGPQGIKAGYTQGACKQALRAAMDELVEQGARVVILGCTELPLVFQDAVIDIQGWRITLVDPTDVLARRCVALARA